MSNRRIAIFIDGSNLSRSMRFAGYRLDYDKVLDYYREQGHVVSASYFTALPPRTVVSNLRKLTDRLQYHGWHIVTKETKEQLSDEGLFKTKGNMDVEIAVRAMEMCYLNHITDLVLFSGDGDFVSLVEALQRKTVRVIAVSHLSKDDDCQIADELRRQVDEFLDLKTIAHRWAMEKS